MSTLFTTRTRKGLAAVALVATASLSETSYWHWILKVRMRTQISESEEMAKKEI